MNKSCVFSSVFVTNVVFLLFAGAGPDLCPGFNLPSNYGFKDYEISLSDSCMDEATEDIWFAGKVHDGGAYSELLFG